MTWLADTLGWDPFAPPPGSPEAGPGLLDAGQMRKRALSQGLLQAGAAMLTGGDPRQPQGWGQTFGRGLSGFAQGSEQGSQDYRRDQLAQSQIDYQKSVADDRKQKIADDAASQKRVEDYIATLPPEQQAMARLAPKEVIAEQIKQMYPAEDAPKTVGGMYWDKGTKSYSPIPGYTQQQQAIAAAGRAPPAPRDQWVDVKDSQGNIIAQRSTLTGKYEPYSGATGKTIEERDQATLLGGDPNSPEYSMAYYRTYMQPKFVPGTDPQGNANINPIMPAVPPGIRKPGSPAAVGQPGRPQAAAPGGPAMGAPGPAAAPGSPTLGAPIPVGIAKGQTEDARKNQQLYGRAQAQLDIALKNYDSLAQFGNQVASGVPGVGNAMMSGPAQQAKNALLDIAASYLYSVSGATANPGEVANLAQTVMPRIGDDPATIADKKARLSQMVDSIRVRASGPSPQTAQPPASGTPAGAKVWSRGPDGVLRMEGAQ